MKIDGLDWMDWLHKIRAEHAKRYPLLSAARADGTSVAKDAPRGRKPLLYIETSVFGFCFDENPRNAIRREAAAALLKQVSSGLFDAVTSAITYEELMRAHEPLRAKLLEAARCVGQTGADKQEVERLALAYVREGIVPASFADDAGHVAYATIGKADVLVSLNLRHLANEWAERRIGAVNLKEGYQLLRIRTPEEVLEYDG